jgi:hypothetical protein
MVDNSYTSCRIDYRRNNKMSTKTTSDIYFAAALLSMGGKISSVDKSDERHMKFTIAQDHSEFKTLVANPAQNPIDFDAMERMWANGTMVVNAVAYKNSIQQMKSVIHSS